ncbi:hypothetical protein EYF80_021933 [Liparis tanakae]|uniref:Uncharacterized protein n=1 Tax=Liparis tanakae TaxID=230148 RepID=A0A4Z2HPL3_9TELE|nr:hypothetical protein EYF80_021933 [Liparis tanakae]
MQRNLWHRILRISRIQILRGTSASWGHYRCNAGRRHHVGGSTGTDRRAVPGDDTPRSPGTRRAKTGWSVQQGNKTKTGAGKILRSSKQPNGVRTGHAESILESTGELGNNTQDNLAEGKWT